MIISEDGTAVQRAKSALMIGYAAGDSRTSVTQDVMLPTTGENGVAVSWASSDAARISTTGTVTQPSAANTEVILTATLTKNDASDTRTFTLTVILLSCETSGLIIRLQAMPPSLRGCPPSSIRGADMPALVSAGVTKEQLLAVWSADRDTGFTPAQLKEAGVTIAEMRSHGLTIAQLGTGGIADYLIFNGACNTPQTRGTAPNPTITLTPTTLNAMDTQVVLKSVVASGTSTRWQLSGNSGFITFLNTNPINTEKTLGNATATLTSIAPLTSTLSIPLADVFSNPTVTVTNNQFRKTNIQLCPGS